MSLVPPQPSGTPSSVLTGHFSVLDFADDFVDMFYVELSQAIEEAVDAARNSLKAAARAIPEWKVYEDILDVEFEGGEFHYLLTGTDEENAAAMELEFGSPTVAPISILRSAALNVHAMEKIITDKMSEGVPVA